MLACVALGLRTAWAAWHMRGHMPSAQCFCVTLVGFLAYLGGSAFGTAGGRLLLGLPQALTSRYATPVLLGWCTLAVARWLQWASHRPVDARAISPWPGRIATALTCGLCLWLLAYQARPLVQPRFAVKAGAASSLGRVWGCFRRPALKKAGARLSCR